LLIDIFMRPFLAVWACWLRTDFPLHGLASKGENRIQQGVGSFLVVMRAFSLWKCSDGRWREPRPRKRGAGEIYFRRQLRVQRFKVTLL